MCACVCMCVENGESPLSLPKFMFSNFLIAVFFIVRCLCQACSVLYCSSVTYFVNRPLWNVWYYTFNMQTLKASLPFDPLKEVEINNSFLIYDDSFRVCMWSTSLWKWSFIIYDFTFPSIIAWSNTILFTTPHTFEGIFFCSFPNNKLTVYSASYPPASSQ